MGKNKPINVYGVFFTPDEVKERSKWHDTTYLEVEIPKELEEELYEIIDEKIKNFQDDCQCGLCKLNQK